MRDKRVIEMKDMVCKNCMSDGEWEYVEEWVDITPEQLQYLKFLEAHKIKEEKIFLSQNQAGYSYFSEPTVRRSKSIRIE